MRKVAEEVLLLDKGEKKRVPRELVVSANDNELESTPQTVNRNEMKKSNDSLWSVMFEPSRAPSDTSHPSTYVTAVFGSLHSWFSNALREKATVFL
jgi:hypothetical protein